MIKVGYSGEAGTIKITVVSIKVGNAKLRASDVRTHTVID